MKALISLVAAASLFVAGYALGQMRGSDAERALDGPIIAKAQDAAKQCVDMLKSSGQDAKTSQPR